ncbi:transposase [Epibacterium mobile]|nr:transposase [Tritonibacter mobilis]NHM23446.1 transposase [Tritonibacter mobilis]NHM23483.1 transposase [Tritonibacter mobilis]
MSVVTIIGIDLAKRVFQLHGACQDGAVAFRKKLSRGQLLAFVARHPKCVIAMEACATAYGCGREFAKLGHDVRLIPSTYVKPFVKRQKDDAADAEAICETALRPTMFGRRRAGVRMISCKQRQEFLASWSVGRCDI